MFKTLRDAWSIAEIRKKLLYTLLMLLIFRLGSAVVVPFLDTSTVSTWMASNATGGNRIFSVYHTIHQRFHHHAAADICTASAGAYA